MEKVLFDRASVLIKLTTESEPLGLPQLIKDTILGTKGLKYTHGRVDDRLQYLHRPYHLWISRKNRIIANLTFGGYETLMAFGKCNAYYVRYFAFRSDYKTSEDQNRETKGNSIVKALISKVMSSHPVSHDVGYGEKQEDPAIHFAYIEPDNMRSLHHALGFNFEIMRKFQTLPFTRLKPRNKVEYSRVREEEKPKILALLKKHYSNHNGLQFHYLFHHNNFFTVKGENDEIIAACQVNDCMFHIENTGSKVFNNVVKVLESTGLSSKILDVKNLRFLSFDHLYCAPGKESVLIDLFESLLLEFNLKLALMWFDTESPYYKMLMQTGDLGWIKRFYSPSPNAVVVNNLNLTENQYVQLKDKPWFISSFDVT